MEFLIWAKNNIKEFQQQIIRENNTMATNLEEITVQEIAGVPNGTICVAEGSYSPSGLM